MNRSPERRFVKVQSLMRPLANKRVNQHMNIKNLRKFFALARELNKYSNILVKKYHMPNTRRYNRVSYKAGKVINAERNRLRQVAREMNTLKRLVPYQVYKLVGPKIYSPKKPHPPVNLNSRHLFG